MNKHNFGIGGIMSSYIDGESTGPLMMFDVT